MNLPESVISVLASRIPEQAFREVRRRVRQVGSKVLVDNAQSVSPRILNSSRGRLREPFLGWCMMLLGFPFAISPLLVPTGKGSPLIGMLVGLVLAAIGFSFAYYVDSFVVDKSAGIWWWRKGILLFSKFESGPLSDIKELRVVEDDRLQYSARTKPVPYKVWATQVVWSDPSRPAMTLPALDLPRDYIDRDKAVAFLKIYAELVSFNLS